jgi:hypothetical protein
MAVAVEPDVAIIDLTELPDPKPDRCLEALAQHLPPLGIVARLGLTSDLEWERQFLHISPRGKRGRPKGSGVKEHTDDAWEIWKQGRQTSSQVCRAVGMPQSEKDRLDGRMRSKLRALPKEEHDAILETRRRARQARKAATRNPRS